MATLANGFGQTTNLDMGLGKFETRLGDDVVTSGFTGELEHYQDKANPADQLKCAQLLSSLRFGEEIQKQQAIIRRPKTAMAALGIPDIKHVTGPYETTYDREYVTRPDPNIRAIRPMTSHAFTHPETVPQAVHHTHYDDEFHKKNQRPASPYRTGTASGQRANKPHPPQSFMVWRFPSKGQPFPQSSPWSEEVTNEKLNQVTKRLCRTTYQNDYLGIPQGFQVKSAFGNLPPDWKERVPYTLHSFQRSTYRTPVQQAEHLLPVNRYGCNSKKHLASSGVIPTANRRAMDIKARTAYDRHFNDTAPEVAHQAKDISRLLVADTIRLQHEKPFVQEKRDTVSRLVEEYEGQGGASVQAPPPAPPSYARPAQSPSRPRPRVPEATPITHGVAYDMHQHRLDQAPISPNSNMSLIYSPPLFLS